MGAPAPQGAVSERPHRQGLGGDNHRQQANAERRMMAEQNAVSLAYAATFGIEIVV